MKSPCLVCACLSLAAILGHADDRGTTAGPGTRPRQSMAAPEPGTQPAVGNTAPGGAGPKFTSEATWGVAGYNNNEVYYTIVVTNQESGIIRCTTEIHGFYFDNGTRLTIADRQLTTVFPNQPTQVGIWMDMDRASGATYTISCHPV